MKDLKQQIWSSDLDIYTDESKFSRDDVNLLFFEMEWDDGDIHRNTESIYNNFYDSEDVGTFNLEFSTNIRPTHELLSFIETKFHGNRSHYYEELNLLYLKNMSTQEIKDIILKNEHIPLFTIEI